MANNNYINQFKGIVSKMTAYEIQIAISKLDADTRNNIIHACNIVSPKSVTPKKSPKQNKNNVELSYYVLSDEKISTKDMIPKNINDRGIGHVTLKRNNTTCVSDKISAIKEIRNLYRLSLRDAKYILDIADSSDITISGLSDNASLKLVAALTYVGYTAIAS